MLIFNELKRVGSSG